MSQKLQVGTVLVDPVSGLKLMVVEEPDSRFDKEKVIFSGMEMKEEEPLVVEKEGRGVVITCDPGMRG